MSKRNAPLARPGRTKGREQDRDRSGRTGAARPASLVAWVCLLIVWVVWGSTYLFIRIGVETMPPLLMAAARNLVAGLIMFPLALRSRRAVMRAEGLALAHPGGVAGLRDRRPLAAGGQRRGGRRREDRAVRARRAARRHGAAVAARHRRGAQSRPARPRAAGRAGARAGRRRAAVRPGRQFRRDLRRRRGHHPGRGGRLGAWHDHGRPGHDPVQPGARQRHAAALRGRGAADPGRVGRGVLLTAAGAGVHTVVARPGLPDRGGLHRGVLRLRHRGPEAADPDGRDLRVREPGDRGPARRARPERAADPGDDRRRRAHRRRRGAGGAPQPSATLGYCPVRGSQERR